MMNDGKSYMIYCTLPFLIILNALGMYVRIKAGYDYFTADGGIIISRLFHSRPRTLAYKHK